MGRIVNFARRVKRMLGHSTSTLTCSTCGRARSDSIAFISGPGVFLCGVCVRDAATRRSHLPPAGGPSTRCRLCGGHRPLVAIGEAAGLNVCVVCIRQMNEMVDEYDQRYHRAS